MEKREDVELRRILDIMEAFLKKSIAKNLKRIMSSKGVSQTKLGEMSGIPQSTISDIMQEKFLANAGKIQMIADALNVPKSEIDPSFKPANEAYNLWDDLNKNPEYLEFFMRFNSAPLQLEVAFEMTERILFEGKELEKEDRETILDMIRILINKK